MSTGRDELAKIAYCAILARDPTHARALNELGSLACASGHRSAAKSAYAQAATCHPGDPAGHVNLANLLLEDGDLEHARLHYQRALAADPDCALAHQGMARILADQDDAAAEPHWQKGFSGHAVVTRRYRGDGAGIPLLLLVAARGGNIPTRHLIDDRVFAVTAIHADFVAPDTAPPPHALVVNAIGDADLSVVALDRAEQLLANTTAPIVNDPRHVRATGRLENARRLATIPDVVTPAMSTRARADLLTDQSLQFPFLVRARGFHTGRHFARIDDPAGLEAAIAAMPGVDLMVMNVLDARGADGLARKYRVMVIDGALYPLHLAIARDWKVHYVTAAMAENAAHRDEERRFLDDMPKTLGARAMTALERIGAMLALDYAGIDFALAPDGSVLLFEANATMVVNPPDPEPMWDYRRAAVTAALSAAHRMLLAHAART